MGDDWQTAFGVLTAKTHSEQAKWWLNGFWDQGGKEEADKIWDICHSFIELDVGFPILYGSRMREFTESSDLDEMKSHVILEKLGETMTVMALRARLKKLDLDNNKRMALSEYLLDKYSKTPESLVNSPQGTVDPVKLQAAQDAFDAASSALTAAVEQAEAAATALAAAKSTAASAAESAATAAAALQAQEAAEAEVAAAVAELAAAIAELEAIEKEYNDKIAALEAKIVDDELSAMKKAKANNELAQLKSEDPMPLRKAKITQKAALKRVEKQKKIAEAATAECLKIKQQADDDKAAADEAETASAVAKAAAETAQAEAEAAVVEAEAQLKELQSGGTGTPQGMLWWMEKTLQEKKKFMR